MGKIAYFLLAPLPANSMMQVTPSGCGNLVVVDYETATEFPAEGWGLVANCTPGGQYGDCLCPPHGGPNYLEITVSSPADGVALEGLYSV